MAEQWVPVVEWEGLYEVSDYGRVRSIGPRGRILKPAPDRKGYLRVCLGHSAWFYIHTLVLTMFEKPRPTGLLGLHRNGDKVDNRRENLYWGTYSDNTRDAVRHGTYANGNTGKTRCDHGHRFSPENTYIRKNGWRQCKACQRAANRRSRRKVQIA